MGKLYKHQLYAKDQVCIRDSVDLDTEEIQVIEPLATDIEPLAADVESLATDIDPLATDIEPLATDQLCR